MQTSQPRKPRLRLSSLFLQRFVALLESIVSSGGDGCIIVVVRNGRIRRLQLRLDQDLPPAADMSLAIWLSDGTQPNKHGAESVLLARKAIVS